MVAEKLDDWLLGHPVLFKGDTITVRNVTLDSTSQVAGYISALGSQDKAKVTAVLKLIDNKKGTLSNREKFKKLESYKDANFFEVKSNQIRIGCVWERNYNLMLLFGCTKKKDDWKQGDLRQLRNIYDKYSEQKKAFMEQKKGASYGQKENK